MELIRKSQDFVKSNSLLTVCKELSRTTRATENKKFVFSKKNGGGGGGNTNGRQRFEIEINGEVFGENDLLESTVSMMKDGL